MIPIYCFEPRNYIRYMYVLYQFDCLHASEVSRLLKDTERTAGVYLNALSQMGYAKSYRYGNKVYWHIVTNGIKHLEKILKETLPIHYGTAHPKKNTKRNLRHDLHGTYVAMLMVDETIDGEQGLLTWAGPTITKILYPRSRIGVFPDGSTREEAMPYYMPDLYLEYFSYDRWGCLNIEIDASQQNLAVWRGKVQKCRAATMFGKYRSDTSTLTIAFVTLRTDEKIRNMMTALSDEFVNHDNPVLVIGTTITALEEHGPYGQIWLSNDGTDTLYELAELTIGDWPAEEKPLLIGTPPWLDALKTGGINLYTYYNPLISRIKPWDVYIPQEERRAETIERRQKALAEHMKKIKAKEKRRQYRLRALERNS